MAAGEGTAQDAINLDTITLDNDVMTRVGLAVARLYRILPLRFENGGRDLVVATARPDNFDMLQDLGFMLSCRIKPVLADKRAIMAAIRRIYEPNPLANMLTALGEIAEPDARGLIGAARAGLRRILSTLRLCSQRDHADDFHHRRIPPHVSFASHVLLATAESGAREATVEFQEASGRLHFVVAGNEIAQYDIPPKWARWIIRGIAPFAKGSVERAIPKGRIVLSLHGESFDYDVTREKTTDGERIVLRLVEPPLSRS